MAFFDHLVKDAAKFVNSKREASRIAALPDVTDDAVVRPSRSNRKASHKKASCQKFDSPVTALTQAKNRLAELQAIDLSGKSANAIKRHKGRLSQARKALAAAQVALYESLPEEEEEEEQEEDGDDHEKVGMVESAGDTALTVRQNAGQDEEQKSHVAKTVDGQHSPAGSHAVVHEPGWTLAISPPRRAQKPERPYQVPTEESETFVIGGTSGETPSKRSQPAIPGISAPETSPNAVAAIDDCPPVVANASTTSLESLLSSDQVVDDANPSPAVTDITTPVPVSEHDDSGVLDIEDEPLTYAELKDFTLNALQRMQQSSPLWPETKKLLWHILGQDQFYGLGGTDYTYRQMFAMLGRDVLGVNTEENEVALRGQDGDVRSKGAGGQ
ncbi:hypothetical protein Tdes44962_MAKER03625 [Teratosphaeria destructans]|uniref:Uncharacterized protein n=1 Tax=Teratosphaeria destructans TaxID=418781 RepID=A0A9W7SPL5_9PEZI|nr:hypothetical protein Tdes44962_MAKER03625 [Teratosphaeria destructans]